MRGFGQGSLPLLGTVLIASSFDGRRGRAMAIATQDLTIAGIVLPGVAAALIAAFGWRAALQIVAVVVVAVLPLGLAVRRTPAALRPRSDTDPAGLVATLRRPGVPRLLLVLAASPLVLLVLALSGSISGGYAGGLIALIALSLTTVGLGWRWRADADSMRDHPPATMRLAHETI